MYRQITKIILIIVAILLVTWNVSMIFMDETDHYISSIIRDYSWKFQTIPLTLGVLIGHWLTGFEKIILKSRSFWLFPIGIVSMMLDILHLISWTPPLIPFIIGAFIGWFFWPMTIPEKPKQESIIDKIKDL
jgi:hypothetical protein